MTLVLDIARPPTLFDAVPEAAEAQVAAPEAPTLATSIASAWSEIAVGQPVACPLCAGPMVPVFGAGALPLGGRCDSCGSRFS
jgi:hypothetical protein